MKILIWIKKEDAISGNITAHHLQCPQPGYQNYIQVEVSRDEFTNLEDNKHAGSTTGRSTENYTYPEFAEQHYQSSVEGDWLVAQYNRNRAPEDWIKTREEIPYIYEKDDNGNVYRRRSGDYKSDRELMTNDEFKSSIKPIVKNLKQLLNEYSTVQGKDFDRWWKSLAKTEQIELTKFWE